MSSGSWIVDEEQIKAARKREAEKKETFRPFSNGMEFMDWHDRNCSGCSKGPDVDQQGPNEKCEIENALALAAVCGGTINDPVIGGEEKAREIADRLGWDGTGRLCTRCPERSQVTK